MIKIENKSLKEIGRYGENVAVNFLEKSEYLIISRNFFCKQGEIDIIAQKEDEIIFCEVKTRTNRKFGNPREGVNFYKKSHMWNSARYFLYINNLIDRYIRFDVIEVFIDKNKTYVNHIKNIM